MGKAAKRRHRKGPGNEEVARRKAERSSLVALVRGLLKDGAFVKVPARNEGDSTWTARDKASGTKISFTRHADRSYRGTIRSAGILGGERELPGWLLDELNDVLEPPHVVDETENPFAREQGDGYEPAVE